jgi:hypothetical protein
VEYTIMEQVYTMITDLEEGIGPNTAEAAEMFERQTAQSKG